MTDLNSLAEREARLIGKRQREVVLALTADWGAAKCHQTAKRLWYRDSNMVDHKHQTDNCWRLNRKGLAVQAILRARAGGE